MNPVREAALNRFPFGGSGRSKGLEMRFCLFPTCERKDTLIVCVRFLLAFDDLACVSDRNLRTPDCLIYTRHHSNWCCCCPVWGLIKAVQYSIRNRYFEVLRILPCLYLSHTTSLFSGIQSWLCSAAQVLLIAGYREG